MGVTISDSITLDSGISISNSYACFSSAQNTVTPSVSCTKTVDTSGDTIYRLDGIVYFYKDKSSRDSGLSHIKLQNISTSLTSSQIGSISSSPSKNFYGFLYDQLKSLYSSTSDVE